MDNRYALRWHVSVNGYEWIPVVDVQEDGSEKETGDWQLTPKLEREAPGQAREYTPLDKPALFREFGALLPNTDAIQEFAGTYGLLRGIEVLPRGGDGADSVFILRSRKLTDWRDAINDMRRAIEMWEWYKAGNAAAISRYITWLDERIAYDKAGKKIASIPAGLFYDALPDTDPDIPRDRQGFDGLQLGPTDVLMAAAHLLQRWVNEHFEAGIAPRLVLDGNAWRIREVPKDLLSALWLQFAISVAEEKEQRQCKVCKTWFDIPRKQDARLLRKEYCSDPCKSRDYRRRKERAQKLKAAGKAPKAIAEELDTDLDIIKKWISKRKG
jgi:hypothetical protein